MGTQCISGGQSPKNNRRNQNQAERIDFVSSDGLVEIVTTGGRKFPPHDYQVVVIRFRPQRGSRILKLNDGSDGVEVLLKHVEVSAVLRALNAADRKARYTWRNIPEKPRDRTDYWRHINAKRHGQKC